MRPTPVRVRRLGRLAVLCVVAAEIAWLAGVNLILNTSPLRKLVNQKPEKVRIEWSHAWSLWPGDLRVRGFVMRGNDATSQWMLSMDGAQAQVGLLALFDRRFLAKGLAAEGVTYHHRRHPHTPDRLAKEPVIAPIPWARYELHPAPEKTPESGTKTADATPRSPKKRVWAADLRGVAGTVRELWIEE